MQPYPTYQAYGNYQMPIQNQFQMQNQNIPTNLTRLVNNFNEIQVNEIPMDGSYKLFAKTDMSEVQARAWNSNGTITTLEYSLKQPLAEQNTDNVAQIDLSSQFEPILAEIKAINEKIDKLNKPNKRKEVTDNEQS